ncbi:MAG: MiaB/RimO family radical SAM methylthiotransferase [Desulfamplus sp.]|nr:MiaB/RimO family radical SAM methylthiotransferase [Desulfamplus sp.]
MTSSKYQNRFKTERNDTNHKREKTFYIATLGCKVNQYESDGIASELVEGGWQKSDHFEDADICIINTCAVTSRAAMQSRQQIRSIIRANSDAKIIVTGCHAQTEPDEIRKIENVDAIIGHNDKFTITQNLIKQDQIKNKNSPFFKPSVTGSKTRAYLKIQDGCNAFCTYCIVPYSRGRSVSMPKNDVIEHLRHLSSKEYKEAILTGIHVGAYGLDFEKNISDDRKLNNNESHFNNEEPLNNRFNNKSPLTDLLLEIERLRPIHRVRLSSIEPKELTDDIIHLAAKTDSILCDHFHIPLQSGDDTILKRMGRPYNVELFANLITKINNEIPTAAIGVDILEGFPGESDEAFENSFNLIKKLPVSYLHVFPFSPRKGTPAYNYPNKVNNQIVKERCAMLRKVGVEKRILFENRQIANNGRYLESVIQDKRDDRTGKLIAVTSNYLSVLVEGSDDLKRQIVNISLNSRDKNNRLTGEIV